jgi:hypothetical protein
VHTAAPAKLHLRSQSVEIDFVARVYRSKADRENARKALLRRLPIDELWER